MTATDHIQFPPTFPQYQPVHTEPLGKLGLWCEQSHPDSPTVWMSVGAELFEITDESAGRVVHRCWYGTLDLYREAIWPGVRRRYGFSGIVYPTQIFDGSSAGPLQVDVRYYGGLDVRAVVEDVGGQTLSSKWSPGTELTMVTKPGFLTDNGAADYQIEAPPTAWHNLRFKATLSPVLAIAKNDPNLQPPPTPVP